MTVSGPRAHERGFTLVELLVVMAVLGVLAWMLLPLSEMHVRRERERELQRALWEIRDAIDAYRARALAGGVGGGGSANGYPPNLAVLVQGVRDAGSGETVYLLRRIPRDPFADPGLRPEQTWALRSFASAPDRPEPGADVYDVSSRSPLVGLNGVPLREW